MWLCSLRSQWAGKACVSFKEFQKILYFYLIFRENLWVCAHSLSKVCCRQKMEDPRGSPYSAGHNYIRIFQNFLKILEWHCHLFLGLVVLVKKPCWGNLKSFSSTFHWLVITSTFSVHRTFRLTFLKCYSWFPVVQIIDTLRDLNEAFKSMYSRCTGRIDELAARNRKIDVFVFVLSLTVHWLCWTRNVC
jgi:hypothetical protein